MSTLKSDQSDFGLSKDRGGFLDLAGGSDEFREHFKWVSERKALRKKLDSMGDLVRWTRNKPHPSHMEIEVAEREKGCKAQKWGETRCFTSVFEQVKKKLLTNTHTTTPIVGEDCRRAMDQYQDQCVKEHLDIMERCHKQGLQVNQAMLKKGLLHPRDHALGSTEFFQLKKAGTSSLPKYKGWMEAEGRHAEYNMQDKRRKLQLRSLQANTNAFWPGQCDHVRLYLPHMGSRPEEVLFRRVNHNL